MYKASILTTVVVVWKYVAAVTVSVEQGMLRGERKLTITGDTMYNSFKGIPYAAAPVGRLRFMAPRSPPTWTGIRDATQHGNVCPQFEGLVRNEYIPGSEDCLFLNVYTPSLNRNAALAVMVYIHGGGYAFGSGNDDYLGPDFLMDIRKIVLVTLNYRLDTLGFLCLDTKEAPGNAGMKDQVAALKWVKRNIHNFGGDPNKVTIFGQSAGAASCTLLALSPMARNLFQRVIAMSASPLSIFSTEFEQTRRAFVLGKKLGCDTDNITALLKCLKNTPVRQLVNTNSSIIASEDYMEFVFKSHYFVPVVEIDFGQERFLIEPPFTSIAKGESKADVLLGYTSAEGIFVVDLLEKSYSLQNYDRFPEVLVPRDVYYQVKPKMHLQLADFIKEYYTGSRYISMKTIPQFVDYITDLSIYPIIRFAKLLTNVDKENAKNVYLYEFTGISERNVGSQQGVKYGIDGVAHTDDLQYIFHANDLNLKVDKNSTSYKMIQQYVALYTNFAIFGNPTPDASLGVKWPKYSTVDKVYLKIGKNLTLATHPRRRMISFWKHIYQISGIQF